MVGLVWCLPDCPSNAVVFWFGGLVDVHEAQAVDYTRHTYFDGETFSTISTPEVDELVILEENFSMIRGVSFLESPWCCSRLNKVVEGVPYADEQVPLMVPLTLAREVVSSIDSVEFRGRKRFIVSSQVQSSV